MTTAANGRHGHSWEGVSVAAERYERDLVPALFEPWAGVLVSPASDRAIECSTWPVEPAWSPAVPSGV